MLAAALKTVCGYEKNHYHKYLNITNIVKKCCYTLSVMVLQIVLVEYVMSE